MEKCDIVEELRHTCRLRSEEVRSSASCLPKYVCDQESQVRYASWSIPREGGLASWAGGSHRHVPAPAEQGQRGGREVGLGAFELHDESVILSQQLAL